MDFVSCLAQLQQKEGESALFQVPDNWGQGRALFGGIAAALALQYLSGWVTDGIRLRSLTVSFVAPLAPGEATATRRLLRQGKSVVQAQVELSQQGQVALVLLASFGVARPSAVQHKAAQQAAIPFEPTGLSLPDSAVVPEFTRHFDYRISHGGLPFSGVQSVDFGGFVRFRQPAQHGSKECSLMQLLALIDAWPPATLPWLTSPAPASTLCWTLELLTDHLEAAADDWWSYLAHIDAAADGYGHIQAKVHDKNGILVALSRQTVALFG